MSNKEEMSNKITELQKILKEKHQLYIGMKNYQKSIRERKNILEKKIEELINNEELELDIKTLKKEIYSIWYFDKYFYIYKATEKELIEHKSEKNTLSELPIEKLEKITSKFYADYILSQYTLSEEYLKNKLRPAKAEAKRINELKEETRNFVEKVRKLEYENEKLKQIILEKDKLYDLIYNKTNPNIDKIISLYSDFLLLQFTKSEKFLSKKERPPYVEIERISELKERSKNHITKYKEMKYKYEMLLGLFPELIDYVDDFSLISRNNIGDLDTATQEFDRAKLYLDKYEYEQLNEIERNQLALDNYIRRDKTNWEIGRDYELYCGQYYEKKGWKVQYYGMEKKLKDLGRDLIAKKDFETHIIQCKYWSKDKLIHEKHILQLYGTTIIEQHENSNLFSKITPVFITNIELSETAKKFAKILNVKVLKLKMKDFPRIKCNINIDENGRTTKIYHLPFDQQYDKTQIKNKGEFYAYTVKEAVDKGFRRAFRFGGLKKNNN